MSTYTREHLILDPTSLERERGTRTAHCNRSPSAYCMPLSLHGVQREAPAFEATASGAHLVQVAVSVASALALPAGHTFPAPFVPPGAFASNVHAVKDAPSPSLT